MKLKKQNNSKLWNTKDAWIFMNLKENISKVLISSSSYFLVTQTSGFNENVTAPLFAFQWSLRVFTHQHIWSTIISVKVRRLMNEKWHKRGPFFDL